MDMLDSLFDPGNVAIIGASREGGKVGHAVLRNFVENRFDGAVYPVNPNADRILGLDCHDSVAGIDADVDLAVVTVPPDVVNPVLRDCVEAGVDAVIVITSGFGEIGEAGADRAAEMRDILDGTDTRLLGPNCLGVWDAFSGVDTLFLPSYKLQRPPAGNIAILTQSGAFGSTVMDLLAEMEIGLSRFISYGNQADITETELIEWLDADEETDAIAVYMEGASDGRDFLEAARETSPDMPIITIKGGKFETGAKAVSSHTGSLAGSYDVYRGAFRQAGIIEAERVEQLFDYSRALAYNPPLQGTNIAVLTNGGGFGVLTADALEQRGLDLAGFSEETRAELRDIIPGYGNVGNPLDLLGDADTDRYEAALDVVMDDPNVDGIIVIPLLQPLPLESDVIDVLVNVEEEYDRPFVTCLTGSEYTGLHMKNLEHNGIAAYAAPDRAADGMAALLRYGEWLRHHGQN